jgi:dipeptidyl aminopeptidase/acylaminoacyl peptidase
VRSPTWSSDGRTIFYVSNRGGSADLWQQALAPDGTPIGEPAAVTQGLGIRSAVFSPDGTRLVYERGGAFANVWRVPLLSDRAATWADAKQLTSERAYIEFVEVSPDGETLAVSSNRRGNQDLWLLPSAGGDMTQLTTDLTPDWNPRWSPDGSQIAFYGYRSGNRDIWVMSSRGGPAQQLSFHEGQDRYPSWSPDGLEIVFQSVGMKSVLIVGAKGGEPRSLPGAGGAQITEWSPDGRFFVFQRQGQLYRVAKDGGEPVLLPVPHRPFSPRISRDSHAVYYSVISGPREHQGHWRLLLENGTHSQLTRLEGRRGVIGDMFSTDDRYLYFSWREDEGDIWVMDVVPDARE